MWKLLIGSCFICGVLMLVLILKVAKDLEAFAIQNDNCYSNAIDAFNTPAIVDSTGEYRILNWPSLEIAETDHCSTTLVSQCSVDQLHYLPDLRLRWQGHISLAIFVATSDQLVSTVTLLMMAQLCSPSTLQSVYIRLVLPLSLFEMTDVPKPYTSNCNNFDIFTRQQQQNVSYSFKVMYPNNILRNIALDASTTSYVLLIDMDMIPDKTLYDEFNRFIGKKESGTLLAYVVPVFEIKEETPIPTDRTSLLYMISQGDVQPFYKDVCQKCQQYTDYSTWYSLSGLEEFGVGYMATWFDSWEPFYILPRSAARYDERFKQYGFNRVSQVC
jgi:hypothetical protein